MTLFETAVRHFCSDPTVNAVLSFYAEAAEREGIPFFSEVDTSEAGGDGSEMFPIVIANTLENALLANRRIDDKEKRFIRIVMISKPQRMLRVENPMPDGTVFDREGFPISDGTVLDREGLSISDGHGGDEKHGIGVKSIRAYAKKHDADLYYRIEEKDGTPRLVMTMIG